MLRDKLARKAGIDPEAARFVDGRVEANGVSISIAELAGGDGMEADGAIEPGSTLKDYSQQSYGAQFAEVGVDMDTGEVRFAPDARRVHRRTHPERAHRPITGNRRHDLRRQRGRWRRR